jgi:hypothetical protein
MIALVCATALGQSPSPDVVSFLRSTATALADAHESGPQQFLDHFDRDMPGYADFRNNIESLVARAEVGTAIEVVTDSGDAQRRELQLDWTLEIQDQRPRRQVVKCTIEKRRNGWKFTALEPVDFFKF